MKAVPLSLILLCSVLISAGAAPADEFFHQFDVGQGSCQLVAYRLADGTQVGVMYDAGTSSQQQPLKFQKNSLEKILMTNTPLLASDFQDEDDVSRDASHSSGDASASSSGGASAATTMSADTQKRQVSITDSIKAKCAGLKHLFLFLSHPDRDHINLAEQVIPTNIDVTVFLCGDWLGDGGANDKYDDVSVYVNSVLKFLSQRVKNRKPGDGKTNFSLPYYWDSAHYKDIKRTILGKTVCSVQPEFVSENSNLSRGTVTARVLSTKDLFNLFKIDFRQPRHVPSQIFKGNLKKLIGYAMRQGDISVQEVGRLANIPGMETILRYVYLWSLNQAADDVNNQSAIVSCSLPDKKMTFVFSGDAHDLVFKDAGLDEDEPSDASAIRELLGRDDHLVWLTLPHHGSINNESFFAWNLFRPSGVLISAGNYKDFGHPSYDLVARIAKTKSKIWSLGMRVMDKDYRFLAFAKTPTGKVAVRTGELDAEHMPILCPNIMGSISMEQRGEYFYIIQEGFSPVVEDDGKKSYLVDYIRHLPGTWKLEADGNLSDGTTVYNHLGNNIYTRSGSFIWTVNDHQQIVAYKADLIP